MAKPDLIQGLIIPAQTKIILLIMDGLGGLPREPGGKTELELAFTPHLDNLAKSSSLGLTVPVAHGITPGSGPGHLAIFGYDPIQYEIGRGAMEALGVDFELGPDDIAARGNFCSIDQDGRISDRRAGRIGTDNAQILIHILETIKFNGVEFFIKPVKEHRFAFIMRAPGLSDGLTDTDPQTTGVTPHDVIALNSESEKAAHLINQFISSARKLLSGNQSANMILLRGFAKLPEMPTFQARYGLKAAAIATNGMYRGVARMVGMGVLNISGNSICDEITVLEDQWGNFDFFYLHVKKTDTFGEMGDFDGKVKAIEEVDEMIPRILALNPDVVVVGGDHSSPAILKSHSWHPVPLLIYSPYVRPDGISEFCERTCLHGSLGILPATQVMPLALANALRLSKYGA